MFTTLFAAASAPATFEWSPKCAVVMIACNVFAYAIARATIRKPNEGFEIPNSKFYGGSVSYTHLTLPTIYSV